MRRLVLQTAAAPFFSPSSRLSRTVRTTEGLSCVLLICSYFQAILGYFKPF
jgi:hypothetical protein